MLDISEDKNYWCLVVVDTDESVWIVHQSSDTLKDEIFTDGINAIDNGIDVSWADGKPAGLYRLLVVPVYDKDDDGRYVSDVDVTDPTLIYEFPSIDSE